MALEELSFESVNGQTDAWTDDGQKVITIAHPEHSSGELINPQVIITIFTVTGFNQPSVS